MTIQEAELINDLINQIDKLLDGFTKLNKILKGKLDAAKVDKAYNVELARGSDANK